MEDLGDFLYIILAIVGVIFSILKKNKKAAADVPPVVLQDDGEDMMSPVSDDNEIINIPKFEKVKESKSQSVGERIKQMESSYQPIQKKTSAKTEKKIEVEDNTSGFEFDIRKAVIYSEILKRPEF